MKIYIAGPISGRPLDEARLEFALAEDYIAGLGHDPVNPFKVAPTQDEKEWADYMRADLIALLQCDAVAKLPGHERSKGATIEIGLAQQLGMQVRALLAWSIFPADKTTGEGA